MFSLSDSIQISSFNTPLDTRTRVANLNKLTDGSIQMPYVGLIVWVMSEEKAYVVTGISGTQITSYKPIGDDVAITFAYTVGTTKSSELSEAIGANKIITIGNYVASVEMVGTGSSAYYVVSYTDKDGVFHQITHTSQADSTGSETTKEFAEVSGNLSATGNIASAGFKNYHGDKVFDIGDVDTNGTLYNKIKNAVHVDVDTNNDTFPKTFAVKNIKGDTIGSIALSTAASGATVLTFTDNNNDSFVATLPNLTYDSTTQMLKMVDAGENETNLIKLSNLQIKTVFDYNTYEGDAPTSVDSNAYAVGDLALVEEQDTTTTPATVSYELAVVQSVTAGTSNDTIQWQKIGSINNVSLNAKDITFTSNSGLTATNVQGAIEEVHNKTSNVRKLNNLTIFTNENGFYITDNDGNIGFKLDVNGNVDGINFGANLKSIINALISSETSSLDIRLSEIEERNWLSNYSVKVDSNGFYLIDENGNIGFKLDANGTFDVMNIGSNIISLIRENIGNLGIESWSKLDAYDTTNPLRHISSDFPFVGIFHSWGFVGDSLSSGEMYGIQTPQTITLDSPTYTDKLYDKDGNLVNYTGGKVYAFSIQDYTYVRVDVSSSDASTLASNYAVICHVPNGGSTVSVVSKYSSSKAAYGSTKNKGTIYVSCLGNVVVQTMTYKVEDKYEYSYGQVLCRMLGLDGYNFSKGGQTVKGFLSSTSERGLTGLLANPKQAYCVALGVNDRNTTYADGIGTGADIDFNDSTNNQNSFVGQYGVLLQNIFSIQPQAKVFVLTPTKVSTNDPIVVGIRSVVSAFRENGYDDRVFLVDLAMYNSYVGNENLLDFTDFNGHRSALGYTYLALMVGTYINQIIRENYDVMRAAGYIGEFDSFGNPIMQDNPIKV